MGWAKRDEFIELYAPKITDRVSRCGWVDKLDALLAAERRKALEEAAKIVERTHSAAKGPGDKCCSWAFAHDAIAAAVRCEQNYT